MIAAASDETIEQLKVQLKKAHPKSDARFLAHGHKVSFSAISKTVLQPNLTDPRTNTSLLDIITLLSALDSVVWDQFGCLSARIHFVEQGVDPIYSPLDYAQHLSLQLRMLSHHLPRGNWSRNTLHTLFDRYKTLEAHGNVQVCSDYEDEFLIVFDERKLPVRLFYQQINQCQGRVIIVKPVASLMEIPKHYLRKLPRSNMQSLSVAIGHPGESLSQQELDFAHACTSCGITAIRSVGRGAFPQLAYSWDGLIPLDISHSRPAGNFSTIEFDEPFDQILDTFQWIKSISS